MLRDNMSLAARDSSGHGGQVRWQEWEGQGAVSLDTGIL